MVNLSDDTRSVKDPVIKSRKGITIYKCAKTNREIAVVSGSSGIRYTIFLNGHYCPCPSFQYTVMQGREAYFCKHLLAVKLSLLMKKVNMEIVNDERVRLLIQEMA